jgi:hypothetical protein
MEKCATIGFQVNTSYTLEAKEKQFYLLSTTLLIFSVALNKDMNSLCSPQ